MGGRNAGSIDGLSRDETLRVGGKAQLQPDLHEEADDPSDHAVEEGVSSQLEGEQLSVAGTAQAPDACLLQVADVIASSRVPAEGAQVVPAQQASGGGAHGAEVQRAADVPGALAQDSRARLAVLHQVAVAATVC